MPSKNTKTISNAALVKQIVDNFNLAYFAFDPINNRFTHLQEAMGSLTGLSLARIQQAPASLLAAIHPDDREFVREQYQKLLEEKTGLQNVEFRTVLPNQEVKWLNVAAALLKDKAGNTFIGGYAEDITDTKAYLHNLLKFNSKKNSTLEILSHDLAAPFGNIEGISGIIRKLISSRGDESLQKLLDLVEEDARRGSTMISDFINNEFLESSQVVLNKERVDLVEKIKIMVDNYQKREELVNKQFIFQVPESPVFLYLDVMKFMQVINNLFSNAIKFTTDQGKIALSLEEKATSVLVTVADNGIGIPEELQPYLFDKFTKARREGIRGEKTVGMGMSIIKTIVELHQGRIWFESQENVGTTFFIEIPKE
ncbi:PAS domain-containing sensor histidine kinase [Pontibacter mangrovi]|uniref:histidine kinase n=1 Tax=Pontibacter mangrovi TaxID=2589816 RepID=A0A501W2I5_9BACT|nr:PAS domain-containing sensor histidine kinase [Pontibacter mangrovi]TPE43478.1 PAS domain S-box protein [Pontibacter mangrovi]